MRSESAAKSRERVAAEALPSSVRFADSYPRGGSLNLCLFAAIAEGATIVRVGTAIYGARDYSKKA